MSPIGDLPYKLDLANEINHSWAFQGHMDTSCNPRQSPYDVNLMDFDAPNYEITTTDHEELYPKLVLLRKRVTEEEARHMRLEKDKEKIILNSIIERDNLMRMMTSLQERNKKLEEKSSNLHSDIFGDMDVLMSNAKKQEQLLKKKENPIISQVLPYKPLESRVEDVSKKDLDKGKKKAVGVQINEPHPSSKSTTFTISKLDLDLEKARKEKDDLAKELEKVENEAQVVESRRKIQFIKPNSTLAAQPTQTPLVVPTISSMGPLTIGQSSTHLPPILTSIVPSLQLQPTPQVRVPLQSQHVGASSASVPVSHKRPIYMEQYRQMSFLGILGFPHPISNEIMLLLVKSISRNSWIFLMVMR